MTKEQKQFNDEAAHLEAANNLADVAISLYGGDAGLHLFGASLEAYTRAHGV